MEAHAGRVFDAVPPEGEAGAEFGALGLTSRYQPIYSAAEHAIHGYEGLLVALDARGRVVPPLRLFERTAAAHDRLYLDWLARALHLRGFARLGDDRGRLFLNVTPHAAIEDARHASVFAALLEQYGVRPEEVVVEILESGVEEEARLADAVGLYKALGCSVALDDFGAGVSEMERIWRLQPDIVKVDRAVLTAAARDAHAARVLKSVVRMMHECGSRVVIEGIEDRAGARLALETNADYLQGYHFARPSALRADAAAVRTIFDDLAPAVDRAQPCAHSEALQATSMALETGATFPAAVDLLLHKPSAMRGYLVSAEGQVLAASFRGEPASTPPLAARGGRAVGWNVGRLVRCAATQRGIVLRTPPYAAFGGARPCTTYGYGFGYEGEVAVLCADISSS
jgi:EAL domain-containing protein (putative c-di-GMP-specific phosphodiesterase class I)